MFIGWADGFLVGIQTLNQILTAGIAITAFSLLLYAFSFNLRDRVARSFALILLCVVIIFSTEAIQSSLQVVELIDILLRLQWIGIIFLPAAYLHLSDALLVTAGRPSRGRRRFAVRAMYVISAGFLVLLALGQLVGALVPDGQPAPHLVRTVWTEIFTAYYLVAMLWAGVNFIRAYTRMLTRSGRRRMIYLMAGATAPALGSYPYLLFGSAFAAQHAMIFWAAAVVINIAVGGLVVVMAYSVAFFGVSWPDRVVKSRLFKWIMRGPVTASTALAVMTLIRRLVEDVLGWPYNAGVPVVMVATVLLMEHTITLVAPIWERWLFFGGDRSQLMLLLNIEERLLTQSDLKQFLEAVLAAVRDHMQSPSAFIAALDDSELGLLVSAGRPLFEQAELPNALQMIDEDQERGEFIWDGYWILPLRQRSADLDYDETPALLGLLGVARQPDQNLESDQRQALWLLADRAALALADRQLQQRVFRSLADLEPQVELLQQMRAVSRYDSTATLLSEEFSAPAEADISAWVRDALTHYWGGPKLTQSPLLNFQVVQETSLEHDGNLANALRAVLRRAVDQVRPEGERRFTSEWILFNILEMKFIEGRKVREVAARLAMSEADLYRKQRVAIEAVGRAILDMESQIKEGKEVLHGNGYQKGKPN
jgi:hypothetical protein